MDRSKMHVAKTGAKAGQWVYCNAETAKSCRNGGTHVEKHQVDKIQTWAGRRAAADVTMQDYVDYRKSEIAGTLTTTQRPMETLAEKRARLDKDGDGRITKAPETRKKQPGTLLREQFKQAESVQSTWQNYFEVIFKDYPGWEDHSPEKLKRLVKFARNRMGDNPTLVHRTFKQAFETGRFPTEREVAPYNRQQFVTHKASAAELRRKEEQELASEIMAYFTNKPFDDSKSAHCEAADPSKCPYHGVAAQKQIKAEKARQAKQANQLVDYEPLNEGTPTEAALLAQLRSYRGERGALGRVPRRTKIIEFMVHNQIVFKGGSTRDDYEFERRSIDYYARNFDGVLDVTNKGLDILTRDGRKYEKNLEERLERYLEENTHNESVKQNIHDEFVRTSKTGLLTTIMNKGHERSEIALRVAGAKKASEIYQLEKEVNALKHQDEFTAAGL